MSVEGGADRVGAAQRQRVVVRVGAARIGVAIDRDAHAGIVAQIIAQRASLSTAPGRSAALSVANSTSSCIVIVAPRAVWRKP